MGSKWEDPQKSAPPLQPMRGGWNPKISVLPLHVINSRYNEVQHRHAPETTIITVPNRYGKKTPIAVNTDTNGLIKDFTILSVNKRAAPVDAVARGAVERKNFTLEEIRAIWEGDKPYFPMHTIHSEHQSDDAQDDAPEQTLPDEEADYEENRVAEAFIARRPKVLQPCESQSGILILENAILSPVPLPTIIYNIQLLEIVAKWLSKHQLLAVAHACHTHNRILPSGERAGFLLGDGPGMGKGRSLAAIIYNNFMLGRKRALWVSISNTLKCDVERDVKDIGASEKINVVLLDTLNYWSISSEENDRFKTGIVFCEYTSLLESAQTSDAKYDKRFLQVCNWLGQNFDGVIVFDECDSAARTLSVENVSLLLKLQKQVPNARVVYVSATELSDPNSMTFMTRLGLWGVGTAHPKFESFANEIQLRSPVLMRLLCMEMKLCGSYMARRLSFKGVSVRIDEVVMTRKFFDMYDYAAKLWAEINMKWQAACRLLRLPECLQKIIWHEFWSAHQQFFQYLCLAHKVENALDVAQEAIEQGKAVVISLQSNEESWTLEHLKSQNCQLQQPVSTLKVILRSFVEKYFPAPNVDDFHSLINTADINKARRPRLHSDRLGDDEGADAEERDDKAMVKCEIVDINIQQRILKHLHEYLLLKQDKEENTLDDITDHDVAHCLHMRYQMLKKIYHFDSRLPVNTMDILKAKLGGHKKVAEITTRGGGIVCIDGVYKYIPRCKGEALLSEVNDQERQCFMGDRKQVAIISEASSAGISLHSDKAASNQRQRVHIILELPWNVDQALQQLGRTHRCNQLHPPEYVFFASDLIGERYIANSVAERLKGLGAEIKDNRPSAEQPDLAQLNINNIPGPSSLYHVIQQMAGKIAIDPAEIPATYMGNFRADCAEALGHVGVLNVEIGANDVEIYSVTKNACNVDRFIQRVRGCSVEIQSFMFQFFMDNLYGRIAQMKRSGRYNMGLLDLKTHQVSVKCSKQIKYKRKVEETAGYAELHTLEVQRGMSYEKARNIYRKTKKLHEGFYELKENQRDTKMVILCVDDKTRMDRYATDPRNIFMQVYRPNVGLQVRSETLESITSRYVYTKPNAAQKYWQEQYEMSLNTCSHIYWNRKCHFPNDCMDGKRLRTYHVLSGRVLPFWSRITQIIEKNGHSMQMIRAETTAGQHIVGIVVPNSAYSEIHTDLSSLACKVEDMEAMEE
ncbi:protein strawberry notch-like [Drosophila guanche]|uniref:Blast:Protein strawberry notch homolog 1 n=1 Tax=Drosophila guanche TaxID=7266 RepID=A0A3B0KC78_DROGU|nr:protein strawberry notch-like [Drosophila guanche]SPP82611.1 blast:Protein strawberry notch homolog 1 [Drosophila guanche]